jgi:hypothetical protein
LPKGGSKGQAENPDQIYSVSSQNIHQLGTRESQYDQEGLFKKFESSHLNSHQIHSRFTEGYEKISDGCVGKICLF